MTEDILKKYYDNYDEESRLLKKSGVPEFVTTIKYVDKYLKNGDRILEIGAGTGRYSHYFAQKGFEVEAVELVQSNIDVFNKNTRPEENINVRQGNALDLSFYGDNSFDITLLLGPMYHLFSEQDKLKALSEAIRVTKKDGVVFVAYCMNEASIISYGFLKGILLMQLNVALLMQRPINLHLYLMRYLNYTGKMISTS
ncbi:MAG: class I SAM-dependent methyltransferase [Lactobacillus sp.]|jgi:ubiquinone/menaquinone biosynthesis C-methylase UbiE|nr:class I SAM-dependent methyltransferase [Lactobacillus sp.]